MVKIPRFLIAAPSSGQGKTMLTIAIMAALAQRGMTIAANKVGPDYIDPGYHYLATGRPSRNLDAVMCPENLIAPLLAHGFLTPYPADIAMIEGVMGLFDGKLGSQGRGSSAHIASLTSTPVIVCADASRTSRTVAATVMGLQSFDPSIHIAGVIFNKVSSPRQEAEIRDAMKQVDIPIIGCVPRHADATTPSRHLGLVPAEERPQAGEQLASFSQLIDRHVDLDALVAIASSAPDLDVEPWDPAQVVSPPSTRRPLVAMAGGKAFTFRYAETSELLAAGGCEVIEFDPTCDHHLPDQISGLYLGGGFPQVHAEQISANRDLLDRLSALISAGIPTVAECAGYLYLTSHLDGHEMIGALTVKAEMEKRLKMGYRLAKSPHDTVLCPSGTEVIGHEFHRTHVLHDKDYMPAWEFDQIGSDGITAIDSLGRPFLHASYLHTHWAGYPNLAQSFINAVHRFDKERS